MTGKPHAPACDRNRDPILAVLRTHLRARRHVLEIGSGTGQHAVHFAAAMPWLQWQCSDLPANLPGIEAWLDDARRPNTPAPQALDLADPDWAQRAARRLAPARPDAVFTANVLHIVGWPLVESLFDGLRTLPEADALLVAYGPFNRGGEFTSESNRAFDAWLKARDPRSGIRDLEALDTLAAAAGFVRVADVAMPANNATLVWRRG